MIKNLTKLLNHRALLKKPLPRFSAEKQVEQEAPVTDEAIEQIKQQLAAEGQVSAEGIQGGEVVAGEQAVQAAQVEEDPFNEVTLLESNWKDVAQLIHTAYSSESGDPLLEKQVREKLDQFQLLYNLDINNLDRVKILDYKEYEIRGSINATSMESNRYLQNDISQDTRIGLNLTTGKRFRQLLENNNLPAIKQLYRNNQFQNFVLPADLGIKIIDSVIASNFENQFLINLLECLRGIDKEKLLIPTKNFEKIIQNIQDLTEVNKLKFFWRINHAVQNGHDFVRHSIISHELAKVKFDGLDETVCQKTLRNAYSAILGKQAMRKLINYSLNKFTNNFNQFIQFWALVNLLISRLAHLGESTIQNPHSLNAIFNLFELNLEEPKDIISQVIPQALFETKNKILFEIYRVHAKFWIERKPDPKLTVNASPFDEFVNNKIDLQDTIQVNYNPWENQNFFPTRAIIRTSSKASRYMQKPDQLLSETKMLEHLIRGQYNFVLNHFLLIFNSGLSKQAFTELRKILQQAKQHQFTDQNARALYILKNINKQFIKQSEPVAFRQQFLTDFKKIRWLERKQAQGPKERKPYLQKMWEQDQGKFSRKRADKFDSQQPPLDNKERIYTKANKSGALFQKKNKAQFSTQKDSYSQYRQVVKQLSTQVPTQFGFSLAMDRYTDLDTFKQQIQSRSKQMNEKNHISLFNTPNLPIVGSGSNLIKYLFLKKPEENLPSLDESLRKKLKVSFVSEIGALQKDFSKYLEGCRFNFPLAGEVYIVLLNDQKTSYVRKSFKTIVAHMVAYKKQLSDSEVQLICDICKKYRIGITLIEIYNLLIENKVLISKEAIYYFCDSLQKFKKINGDTFLMTKKYCENINIPFEVNMMSSYTRSLLIDEQDEKLAQLCQTLKTQLKPKPYKLRQDLSAEENIKKQKQHKQYQKKEYNRILNEVINMVVMNVNTKLPLFVSELFDEYQKTQPILEAKQTAISLIVYCNNVDKFLEIIRSLKAQPQKIIISTYECALKALRLNLKVLQSHSQQIFNTTLFIHNFILNEDLINKSVQIFKNLSSPTVFIKFLQYMLRYNPPVNYEIKNGMYFVMNNINDDFAKNTISGLLDFIFNVNREKEREEYRKAQIAEEEKAKLLKDLEKKDFFLDQTENQKEQIVNDIQKGKLEEAKKPKKNKSTENLSKKEIEKSKNQAAAAIKAEKKKINIKGDQQLVIQSGDGTIKRSNLKPKLRTKSLMDFEDMFAQKEEVVEDQKAKGKGNKQPVKDTKKKGKGK